MSLFFLLLMPCSYNNSFMQVPEKRWYWLKAFALATVKDWDALEKFSKEKKPPGGMIFYSLQSI